MKLDRRNYFFKEIIKILNHCQVMLIEGNGNTDGSTTFGENEITIFTHKENNAVLTLIHEALHQYFGHMEINEEETVENLSRELFTTFNDKQLEVLKLYLEVK